MLRTATLYFQSASPEEVIDLLAKNDLAEGSKFDQRYPGARMGIIMGLHKYGLPYPDSKWAWSWVVSQMKKKIVPALYERIDPESFSNKEARDQWTTRISELTEELANRKATLEAFNAEHPEIHEIPYENGTEDFDTKQAIRQRRDLGNEVTRVTDELRQREYNLERHDKDIQELAETFERDPEDTIWMYNPEGGGAPRTVFSKFMEMKALADRYNEPINLQNFQSIYDINGHLRALKQKFEEQERSRELKGGFESGRYAWDAEEPLYTFKDGWTVMPVASGNDLQLEGELMRHCIGDPGQSHFNRIQQGLTSAVSLRDPNGIPHATAELTDDGRYLDSLYGVSDHALNDKYADKMREYFSQSPLDPESRYFRNEMWQGGQINDTDMPVADGDGETIHNYDNEPDDYWNETYEIPRLHNETPIEFLQEMRAFGVALRERGDNIAATAENFEYDNEDDPYELEHGDILIDHYTREAIPSPLGNEDIEEFIEYLYREIAGAPEELDGDEEEMPYGYGVPRGQWANELQTNDAPEKGWDEDETHQRDGITGPRPSEDELWQAALGLRYLMDWYDASEGTHDWNTIIKNAEAPFKDDAHVEFFNRCMNEDTRSLLDTDASGMDEGIQGGGQMVMLDQRPGDDWDYLNEDAPEGVGWTGVQDGPLPPTPFEEGEQLTWQGAGGTAPVTVVKDTGEANVLVTHDDMGALMRVDRKDLTPREEPPAPERDPQSQAIRDEVAAERAAEAPQAQVGDDPYDPMVWLRDYNRERGYAGDTLLRSQEEENSLRANNPNAAHPTISTDQATEGQRSGDYIFHNGQWWIHPSLVRTTKTSMFHTSTMLFLGATPAEVIDLIAKSDLPEDSKWNEKFPKAREAILGALRRIGTEDNKYALRWMTSFLKKQIVPKIFEQFSIEYNQRIQKEIQEVKDAQAHEIEQYGHPQYWTDEKVAETIASYSREANQRKERWLNADPEDTYHGTSRQLLDYYADGVDMWNIADAFTEMKRNADEFNIPVDLGQMKTGMDVIQKNSDIRNDVQDRQRIKRIKEGFKDGKYSWEAKPIADAGDGYTIWPIASGHDAKMEGQIMQHCIGQEEAEHYHDIAYGSSSAVSLRDKDGISHVSAELTPDGKRLKSMYGVSDQQLNDKYKEKMEAYFKDTLDPSDPYWETDRRGGYYRGWHDHQQAEGGKQPGDWKNDKHYILGTEGGRKYNYYHGLYSPDSYDNEGQPIYRGFNDDGILYEPEPYILSNHWKDEGLEPPEWEEGEDAMDYLPQIVKWYEKARGKGYEMRDLTARDTHFDPDFVWPDTGQAPPGGTDITRPPVFLPMSYHSFTRLISQVYAELGEEWEHDQGHDWETEQKNYWGEETDRKPRGPLDPEMSPEKAKQIRTLALGLDIIEGVAHQLSITNQGAGWNEGWDQDSSRDAVIQIAQNYGQSDPENSYQDALTNLYMASEQADIPEGAADQYTMQMQLPGQLEMADQGRTDPGQGIEAFLEAYPPGTLAQSEEQGFKGTIMGGDERGILMQDTEDPWGSYASSQVKDLLEGDWRFTQPPSFEQTQRDQTRRDPDPIFDAFQEGDRVRFHDPTGIEPDADGTFVRYHNNQSAIVDFPDMTDTLVLVDNLHEIPDDNAEPTLYQAGDRVLDAMGRGGEVVGLTNDNRLQVRWDMGATQILAPNAVQPEDELLLAARELGIDINPRREQPERDTTNDDPDYEHYVPEEGEENGYYTWRNGRWELTDPNMEDADMLDAPINPVTRQRDEWPPPVHEQGGALDPANMPPGHYDGERLGDYEWHAEHTPEGGRWVWVHGRQGHTAAAGENWVYVQHADWPKAQVATGKQPHHSLLLKLEDLDGDPLHSLLSNTWLAQNGTPEGLPHGVARGVFDKKGRPAIWESNVDRNSVWDAVKNSQRVAAISDLPPQHGLQPPAIVRQAPAPGARGGLALPPGVHVHKLKPFKKVDDKNNNVYIDTDYCHKVPGPDGQTWWSCSQGIGEDEWEREHPTAPKGVAPTPAPGPKPMPAPKQGGIAESTEELYAEIQGMGWDVMSQGPKGDEYAVVIQSPDGARVTRTGDSPERAMASAATWAWQHSHMSKTAVVQPAMEGEPVYDSMGDMISADMYDGEAVNSYVNEADPDPAGSLLYKVMPNGIVWVDSIYTSPSSGNAAALELFNFIRQNHPGAHIEGMFMHPRLKQLAEKYNASNGHESWTDDQRLQQTGWTQQMMDFAKPMWEQANPGRTSANSKMYKRLHQLALQQGWRERRTKSGWQLYSPDGISMAAYHLTESDWRGIKNFQSQLEKGGLVIPSNMRASKEIMDLPISSEPETLGQVFASLKPGSLDGTHLGFQAHKLGYSMDELRTFLSLEQENNWDNPQFLPFKQAAISAMASRGWERTAALKLVLWNRLTGQKGGPIVQSLQEGQDLAKRQMQNMGPDGQPLIYRAQVVDDFYNTVKWDTDDEWQSFDKNKNPWEQGKVVPIVKKETPTNIQGDVEEDWAFA